MRSDARARLFSGQHILSFSQCCAVAMRRLYAAFSTVTNSTICPHPSEVKTIELAIVPDKMPHVVDLILERSLNQ